RVRLDRAATGPLGRIPGAGRGKAELLNASASRFHQDSRTFVRPIADAAKSGIAQLPVLDSGVARIDRHGNGEPRDASASGGAVAGDESQVAGFSILDE